MDQSKWKSVVVPRDTYHDMKLIAQIEGRTISRQLRMIVEQWMEDHLTDNDLQKLETEKIKLEIESGAHASSFSI
jgi:predicted DNA-binding protein